MPVTAEQTIWLFSFLGVHWLTCSWSQMEASSELLGLHHTQSVSMCLTTLLDSILFSLWIACCLLKPSPLCLITQCVAPSEMPRHLRHSYWDVKIKLLPWLESWHSCLLLAVASHSEGGHIARCVCNFLLLWFSEQVLWLVRVAGSCSWKVRNMLYFLNLLYIM